ncbi:uncharacterized protein LOC144859658 isoform X1 [Branchiostoma floridae x Branchiostoma japonicum]
MVNTMDHRSAAVCVALIIMLMVDPTKGVWLEVFATEEGVGQTVMDAWNAAAGAEVRHYKCSIVEQWSSLTISRVKIVLEASDGNKEFIFDGANSDKTNWFTKARLLSSPYTDIQTSTPNYFSVVGLPEAQRRFYINRNHGGCGNDAGWLVVADAGMAGICNWEKAEAAVHPHVLYSKLNTAVRWDDTANVGKADRMRIYLEGENLLCNPPVDISCTTEEKTMTKNAYSVTCPSGCTSVSKTVWGTETYTDDSSICRAAIHAGWIPDSGGTAPVYRKPGESSYTGSTQNGVTTVSYGSWPQSFAFGVNIALRKQAFQTSTAAGGIGEASLAVDGKITTTYSQGSCSHTANGGEAYPTWWVDLGQSYVVRRVVITNRRDCCSDRLNPFNIHIGDSAQVTTNPQCGGDHNIALSLSAMSVTCPEMRGRYVGIHLPGASRILTLCEVQIFGDLDECTDGTDNCSPQGSTCTNTPSSFTCACDAGYSGDGVTCTDDDECTDGSDNCSPDGFCTNTPPGSFTCACNPGYSGNGVTCSDIDECANANGGCEGTCTNNGGSFVCSCGAGFVLNADGLNCDDVNECDSGNGGCSQTCTNNRGSFVCSCRHGYSLNADGLNCDLDCGVLYPGLLPASNFGVYGGKCFWSSNGRRPHNQRLTYSAALQACQGHGGTLIMIKDHATQTAILDHLKVKSVKGRKERRFWMGLDDLNAENTFLWNDGTPLGSYDWFKYDAPHQERDCVTLWKPQKRVPRWFIKPCENSYPYICQLGTGNGGAK